MIANPTDNKNTRARLATLQDIPELVKLRLMMILEDGGSEDAHNNAAFKSEAANYFDETIRNKSYLGVVVEVNHQLVATGGVILYRKPPAFSGTSGLVGYISNVYTIPQYRGQGLASEILRLLIATAKSAGASKLHLGTTEKGRGLYEKFGFKDVTFPALELRL